VMQLYDSYLADPDTVSEQKVLERVKLVGKGKITKAVARASSNCHTNWIKVSERILEALMEEAKERLSIRQVVVLLISAFGTETQVGALTPTAVRLTPDLLRRVLAKRSTEVEVAMEMYLSLLDPEERLLLDR